MSGKYVRAVLVGLAVTIVISGGLGFLAGAAGRPVGLSQLLPGMIFGVIVAFLLANLAGTRRSAVASAEMLTAARAMRPPAERALIYVYREGFVGMAAGLDVGLDEQPLAQLKSPRFSCCGINPGEHVLTGAFGGLAGPQNRPATHAFSARPGDILVFRFEVALGGLKNTVRIVPLQDTPDVRARLARMRMTAPEPAWAF